MVALVPPIGTKTPIFGVSAHGLLLPELSIPAAGQKDRRLWGREWTLP